KSTLDNHHVVFITTEPLMMSNPKLLGV
ncbi:hypothetical protein CCACVL1_17909, partial [Corchorus capsularis]